MTYTPIRTCVACRRERPKHDLVRLVRRPDGSIAVDREGREPGRGAYVCPEPECVRAAGRRGAGALRRALRGGSEDELVAALQGIGTEE